MLRRDPAFAPARRALRRITGITAILAGFLMVSLAVGQTPRPAASKSPAPVRTAPVRTAPAAKPAAAKPATTAARPAAAPAKAAATPGSNPPAVVNGEPITREELGRRCIARHGEQVLESMLNKQLIAAECAKKGCTVTEAEVQAEIERMATRFNLRVDFWLTLLEEERGIKAKEYASEIVWPTLALRKLAGDRLAVSKEELQREYETEFGESVAARIIVLADKATAESVQKAASANPADFGNLAKKHSIDAHTASVGGVIPPIHKHVGYEVIEKTAFSLADGQVSPAIAVGNQYIILMREKLIPARQEKYEDVQLRLYQAISDAKLRQVADEVFHDLQKQAKVENLLAHPSSQPELAGVAAVVNGQRILLRDLAEECIARHGEDVLETMVNRRMVEQACKRQKIAVSDEDIDAEITRMAGLMLPAKEDGSPDVAGWIRSVCTEQQINEETYRHDIVWPAVALRKLVGDAVQITDEELQKGYEANYGPRVRCLAIVLNNVRLAQQVWEMARDNLNPENFGDLAAQYSVEAGSRTLRGQVPPIQKHGGQPVLEEEAFKLKAGELSGVIQVDDKYVILFCEGYTEPTKVDFAKVRDLIEEDIHEKKLQVAMADTFEQLSAAATVDNYLAGESRSPKKPAVANKAALPTLQEVAPRR